MADWKENLINDAAGSREMLADTKTIAVLGIKPESHAGQPAYYVPAHMDARRLRRSSPCPSTTPR